MLWRCAFSAIVYCNYWMSRSGTGTSSPCSSQVKKTVFSTYNFRMPLNTSRNASPQLKKRIIHRPIESQCIAAIKKRIVHRPIELNEILFFGVLSIIWEIHSVMAEDLKNNLVELPHPSRRMRKRSEPNTWQKRILNKSETRIIWI